MYTNLGHDLLDSLVFCFFPSFSLFFRYLTGCLPKSCTSIQDMLFLERSVTVLTFGITFFLIFRSDYKLESGVKEMKMKKRGLRRTTVTYV